METQRRALKVINRAAFLPRFTNEGGKRSAGSVDTGRRCPPAFALRRREVRSTCKSVSLPATGPKPPPVEREEAEGQGEAKPDTKKEGRWKEKGRLSEMKIKC